jgi:hypothetical protein
MIPFFEVIFINMRATHASDQHMLDDSTKATHATADFYRTATIKPLKSLHAKGMKMRILSIVDDGILS